MGGSQVKEAFRLLRERASAHGRTVTEEITSLTGPGDEALQEEAEEETVGAR
jgi:nucleotide-binding universal stress UspA family protein